MTLAVRATASDQEAQEFSKQATRLTLSEIIENVEVNEQLLSTRSRRYTVLIHFYPRDEYENEHEVEPSEILTSFAVAFPSLLRKEIASELKKLDADVKSLNLIGKGKAVPQTETTEDADADASAGGDDASEVGDGDADYEKRTQQTKEITTYDTDEEDEDMQKEYDDAAIEAEFAEPDRNEDKDSDSDESDTSVDEIVQLKAQATNVRNLFCANMKAATRFEFSDKLVRFDLEVSYGLHSVVF